MTKNSTDYLHYQEVPFYAINFAVYGLLMNIVESSNWNFWDVSNLNTSYIPVIIPKI
jgi:hypothetical protein